MQVHMQTELTFSPDYLITNNLMTRKIMASNKALIFETLDSGIYPLDSTIGFSNTYPPDSDLSSG